MQLRKRLQSKLLVKYILSYLFVFIVPFTIMSFIVYQNSILGLREEATDSIQNKMKQADRYTTERMKELDQLAVRMANDFNLTPYMIKHPFYSKNAINQLHNYKANSSIIDNVFLYYQDDPRVYSSEGTATLSTVFERVPPFDEWSKESFEKSIEFTTSLMYTGESEQSTNTLLSLHPIPNGNPHPYGAVMYTIKESALVGLISDVLGDFKGNTYILDSSNNIITASRLDDSITNKAIQSLAENKETNGEINYKNEKYHMNIEHSDYNNWKIISLVNVTEFNKAFFKQKLFNYSLLILLLLLGLGIAILFADRQYQPIRNLFEKMNFKERTKEANQNNELSTINHAISDIYKSNQALNDTIDLQKPFARDQMLLQLLKGDNLEQIQEHKELFTILNIEMYHNAYFVIILNVIPATDESEQLKIQADMLSQLETKALVSLSIHPIDLFNNAIALIVSSDYTVEQIVEKREAIITDIKDFIQKKTKTNPSISVGSPYPKKSLINRSYIEALAAMDNYQPSDPQGTVSYFENRTKTETEGINYPDEDLVKLTQSIKHGNNDVANEVIDTIFKELQQAQLEGTYLKAIYFDIINTVLKAINELGISKDIGDIDKLVHFGNPEQLKQNLKKTIAKACNLINTKKTKLNQQLFDDITTYIRQNYNTYHLSLENMAQHFQLSIPYLSRFIKEQFGVTFTQYVFSLRLNEVKKQLLTTDKLIRDIILEVGYRDVSNFNREFKKVEGVTPGQYRKLNKADKK
ncbi:AraC family transcriptional regulator [Paraliobacillus salinarum]|uniref:AraC family transcriptional regulator n=1 Tax=Paraliobacillus salinarum TaxID=1158996 RepID=UPI0015F3B769|nr:AraC family transcriptional regulator [Paraliobacillus salinarum]